MEKDVRSDPEKRKEGHSMKTAYDAIMSYINGWVMGKLPS